MDAAGRARELGLALVFVEGNTNEARRLISSGADVNYVHRWLDGGKEFRSVTPLIRAAGLAHANVMSVLIEKGAEVRKQPYIF
jgi:ankyrin repeat protein